MRVPTMNGFDNQFALIQAQYANLSQLLTKQATQKQLIQPSDDIALSNQIKSVGSYITNIESYKQNITMANNRSGMLDKASAEAVTSMDRIKQLISDASNDLKSDQDRVAIAGELQGLLKNLLNTSNSQDGSNNFLFSGSACKQVPYVYENGKYVYYGSQENTNINIGINVDTIYNQSGYLIFDHLFDGNSKFAISAGGSNTGTASTTVGSVVNQAAYVEDTYTLSFVTNSAGHLAYQVTGATSGQVFPPPPAVLPADAPDYVQDGAVSFNGMDFTISGMPNVGDSFVVKPSKADNVFNAMTDLIDNLKTPVGSDTAKRAKFHQALSQSTSFFNTAFNRFVGYRSEVGQRMQTVQKQESLHEYLVTGSTETLSKLADADPIKIQTAISQQMIFMQATQSTYMQIQNALMSLLKMSL